MRAHFRKPENPSSRTPSYRTPSRHAVPTPTPTPRADRRHAERLRMIAVMRRSALFGGPALAATIAAGVVLATQGAAPATLQTSVSDSAAGLATWRGGSGSSSKDPASRPGHTRGSGQDLGTVSGKYMLLGPDTVPAGAKVSFLLTGPARLLRTVSAAPYAVSVDTATIPDGRYRLVVTVTSRRHHEFDRFRLTVANGVSAPAPTTSGTTAPTTAEPTTAEPTTAEPTTAEPTTTRPTTTAPTTPPTTTTTTTVPRTTITSPASSAPSSAPSSPAAQVLAQTNTQRVAAGCGALTVDARLTSAAQAHTADMAANNYFAHDSQDGRSPFDRMTAAGYRFSTAGENIAMGYRTATDVMTGWMNSPGHRANILNCSFTNIGIGYAVSSSGAPYWTQDFGRPA